jgi:hypothetical protein
VWRVRAVSQAGTRHEPIKYRNRLQIPGDIAVAYDLLFD